MKFLASVNMDSESLAEQLAFSLEDDDLISFVVSLDECVGDLSFTRALRDKLTEEIDFHEKS